MGRIFICGDTHGTLDLNKLKELSIIKKLTFDDYVIICGDCGIVWNKDLLQEHIRAYKSLYTNILFVDGNHENFDRLYSDEFEVVDFHGGKAHKIRENVYHLMRGYIFDICGKKIFAFGGASSHDIDDGILDRDDFDSDKEFNDTINDWYLKDKWFRINHISWWAQEMPSQEEMDFGLKTLADNGNKVDYIVSHCCPQEIASIFSHGSYKPDKLTQYFNDVKNTVEFDKWFFGHYHDNQQILGNFYLLYEQIVRVV